MQSRLMVACLLVLSVTAAIWVVSQAAPTARVGAVWHQVMYDGAGTLRAARGLDHQGNPLTMTMRARPEVGKLRARIEFNRAGERLSIDREYVRNKAMNLRYTANEQILEVRARREDATGGLMVSYFLSDGTVYSMWTDSEGNIKDGNMKALKRVVSLGSGVPDLLPLYLKNRRALGRKMPVTGEEFLSFPGIDSCRDRDEQHCRNSCNWECNNGSCEICQAVCRTSMEVGCGG